MVRNISVFLIFSFLIADTAFARDGGDSGEAQPSQRTRGILLTHGAIVVSADGLGSTIDSNGLTISTLDLSEIVQVQGPDIARALQRLPGLSLTRNGGLGGFTGLSVRGAASERVLVLVDGVRLNDVAGPAGGFDFGSLTTGSVGRVELLRGSSSLVWGSDALAGVVHITSRSARGIEASAEYGGDDQFSGQLAVGQSGGGVDAAMSASYLKAGGFSSAAAGTEADGFEQLALTARGNFDVGEHWQAFASGRYASGEAGIDGFPAPAFTLDDTLERQDTSQLSARGGLDFSSPSTTFTASFARARTERDLVDEAVGEQPYFTAVGLSDRAEIRARQEISNKIALVAGSDWEWTEFAAGGSSASAEIGSAHALIKFAPRGYSAANDIHLSFGGRYDHHQAFGGEWSLGGNATWQVSIPLRLTASYGEGFKAPSLFQLHSDFGNLALGPERSRSWDAGLHYADFPLNFTLTAFRRDSRDLIDFKSCFGSSEPICTDRPIGTYDNVGRARSQGIELEGEYHIVEGLEAAIAYAFIDSTNRETSARLARRPNHAGTISLDWQAYRSPVRLGADWRVVSATFDDAANAVRLPGHAVLDLRASVEVSGQFTFYGRVENIWNERYQTAAGYNSSPRAAYLGVRARY